MQHPLENKCYYSIYLKRIFCWSEIIGCDGKEELWLFSYWSKSLEWHTLEAWHTKSAAFHSCALHTIMTSCWVSLGFGAQLAICNCHFKRVSPASLHFQRWLFLELRSCGEEQRQPSHHDACYWLPLSSDVIKRAVGSDTCQSFGRRSFSQWTWRRVIIVGQ